jgi:ribosome biogenesis protein Nip4
MTKIEMQKEKVLIDRLIHHCLSKYKSQRKDYQLQRAREFYSISKEWKELIQKI